MLFLLVSSATLLAEEPPKPIDFGIGFSMVVPAGWDTSVMNMEAPPLGAPNFQTSTLLLHARPVENASVSIVQQGGPAKGGISSAVGTDILGRLEEIALEQGYRVDTSMVRGNPNGPQSVVVGEVQATDGVGRRRVFTCVHINQFPRFTLRCYWQWNEGDLTAKQEFNNWFASAAVTGKKIADLMAGQVKTNTAAAPTPSLPRPFENDEISSPPTAAAAAKAAASGHLAQFVAKNQESLFVVEGDRGRGSGFVCQDGDGKKFLFTNAHVLSANPNPKFTTMNGTALTAGATTLAVGYDVFKAAAPENGGAFAMMSEADGPIKIGDPIAVLGNSEGEGVVKALEGRVVGLGPDLVEVDAPFVPGNSGSPIIHIPTGKVIGIASYLIIRRVPTGGGGAVETSVRRFGYRLDKVKSWEDVDWRRFNEQSAQLEQIRMTSAEFEKLFGDAAGKTLSSKGYTYPGIRRALENLERATESGGNRMSTADIAKIRRDFLGNLRNAAMQDINTFDVRTAYDYFRARVAEEKKFREDIAAGLTRMMGTNP